MQGIAGMRAAVAGLLERTTMKVRLWKWHAFLRAGRKLVFESAPFPALRLYLLFAEQPILGMQPHAHRLIRG